jgi:predicted GNAT family N-acyltransferase
MPCTPDLTSSAKEVESQFAVRPVTTMEERAACYRLRYDVYVAEQGKPYPNADHARRLLTDGMDNRGIVLGAFLGESAIGTLRVNFNDDQAFVGAYDEKLGLKRFFPLQGGRLSFASRLAVDPRYRYTSLFRDLVVAAYRVGAPAEVAVSLCTCRPALVSLFEHLGYTAYGPRFVEKGGGQQRSLFLVTRDHAHLRRVQSPFMPLAACFPEDPDTRPWLEKRFRSAGDSSYASTR